MKTEGNGYLAMAIMAKITFKIKYKNEIENPFLALSRLQHATKCCVTQMDLNELIQEENTII
jgi:hypothetical protein